MCLKASLFVLISSGLPTAAAVSLPPDGEVLVEGVRSCSACTENLNLCCSLVFSQLVGAVFEGSIYGSV